VFQKRKRYYIGILLQIPFWAFVALIGFLAIAVISGIILFILTYAIGDEPFSTEVLLLIYIGISSTMVHLGRFLMRDEENNSPEEEK